MRGRQAEVGLLAQDLARAHDELAAACAAAIQEEIFSRVQLADLRKQLDEARAASDLALVSSAELKEQVMQVQALHSIAKVAVKDQQESLMRLQMQAAEASEDAQATHAAQASHQLALEEEIGDLKRKLSSAQQAANTAAAHCQSMELEKIDLEKLLTETRTCGKADLASAAKSQQDLQDSIAKLEGQLAEAQQAAYNAEKNAAASAIAAVVSGSTTLRALLDELRAEMGTGLHPLLTSAAPPTSAPTADKSQADSALLANAHLDALNVELAGLAMAARDLKATDASLQAKAAHASQLECQLEASCRAQEAAEAELKLLQQDRMAALQARQEAEYKLAVTQTGLEERLAAVKDEADKQLEEVRTEGKLHIAALQGEAGHQLAAASSAQAVAEAAAQVAHERLAAAEAELVEAIEAKADAADEVAGALAAHYEATTRLTEMGKLHLEAEARIVTAQALRTKTEEQLCCTQAELQLRLQQANNAEVQQANIEYERGKSEALYSLTKASRWHHCTSCIIY